MNKTTEALKLAEEALNAMLTHMGMDEDEWTKPTFNQAREALAAIREALAEHSGDANEMVADTNPLSVFAKECVLGAYTYDELPDAARLALKREKKAEPWKCACGANLYINSDGAPTSRLKPVKQEPVAFKVHRGEVCYKSDEDDQSYGMWCPVSPDYRAPFPEGINFYAAPVSAEAIRAEALEEAAKVCEKAMIQMNYSEAPYKQCAAAIRGLK